MNGGVSTISDRVQLNAYISESSQSLVAEFTKRMFFWGEEGRRGKGRVEDKTALNESKFGDSGDDRREARLYIYIYISTGEARENHPFLALNRVIASVNIRLPGCIVLRSSWGKVLIRLPFRVVGLDISESPRRSIVLGPRVALQPFPSPFVPSCRPLSRAPRALSYPTFLLPSRFNSRESLYASAPRLPDRPLFPCSESSRPEVIRCLDEHRSGGSRGRREGVRSVDGVFRGGDMESGNSCLAG